MTTEIVPIIMPKWGLAMLEGTLTTWMVEEGVDLTNGDEIAEIESTKIANVFESPVTGTLRRFVAAEGETLPVGALLAVSAPASVPDADIDAFIADFQENFVPPEADDEGGPEPVMVEVGDHRISVLQAGEGDADPILLIHGFGADKNGWMFNHTVLAEDRAVYAMDLPGHGASSKTVGSGDIQEMAEIVTGLIKALELTSVHLVGHSLGGAVAIAAAGDVPIKSLSVIAPGGLGVEINGEFLQGFIDAKRGKHLKPHLEKLVHDKSLISRDMMDDIQKFKRIDGVPAALQTFVDVNFEGGQQKADLKEKLAAISAPVAVIWGEGDEIIPSSHADGLPANVSVTIIKEAGHIPQMEKASEVNDIISANVKGA